MKATICCLAGDGIGPEIIDQAVRVLQSIASRFGHRFDIDEQLIGGIAIDKTGVPLPKDTLLACKNSDAVLLGAVGGPKWDDPSAQVRPEQGLLAIRKELGLYANIRPLRFYPALAEASPIKADRLCNVDLLMVRELTGGLYFGEPRRLEQCEGGRRAIDTMVYSESEIRRVLRRAFQIAQGRRKLITSVDKANVLETSKLWRDVATQIATEFPEVRLEHQLVDSCAMRLVTAPASFDVIVTENMFGDILSDEAAVLCGSLGLLPSASLGEGRLGLYEPIHGSAPDIAGRGLANPLGMILSLAMLLRHSLGLEQEAAKVEWAVERAIDSGGKTKDLGGTLSTEKMAERVLEQLH